MDDRFVREDFKLMCLDAFAHVQAFGLNLISRGWPMHNKGKSPELIVKLLDSMSCPKDLRLHLAAIIPGTFREQDFFYEQIFPASKCWLQSTDLTLVGLRIKGTDLAKDLRVQMPQLCRLKMAEIDVAEGTWEGVIEALRRLELERFELDHRGHYTHLGSTIFDEDNADSSDSLTNQVKLKAVEDYVTNGGRHPCLPATAMSCAADYYLQEMFPDENIGGCTLLVHSSACRFSNHIEAEQGLLFD